MLTTKTSRRQALAAQAWENLNSAVESAGHSTRAASRRAAGFVDDASGRVGAGAKEARRRANAAMDALAGHRPPTPWVLLAVATGIGAVVGWAATVFGRRLAPNPEAELTGLTDDDVDLLNSTR
jgi:ElaB/YqjD/DUF883 family membrane-anchored ribosome-binding protein